MIAILPQTRNMRFAFALLASLFIVAANAAAKDRLSTQDKQYGDAAAAVMNTRIGPKPSEAFHSRALPTAIAQRSPALRELAPGAWVGMDAQNRREANFLAIDIENLSTTPIPLGAFSLRLEPEPGSGIARFEKCAKENACGEAKPRRDIRLTPAAWGFFALAFVVIYGFLAVHASNATAAALLWGASNVIIGWLITQGPSVLTGESPAGFAYLAIYVWLAAIPTVAVGFLFLTVRMLQKHGWWIGR